MIDIVKYKFMGNGPWFAHLIGAIQKMPRILTIRIFGIEACIWTLGLDTKSIKFCKIH